MRKDGRYINAGTNEIYRYGKKAREYAASFIEPNKNGYISFPVDAGKYWTIGTSEGKYGEFAKYKETIFSVNNGGYMYAKAGTEKADKLVDCINGIITEMKRLDDARFSEEE